MNTVKCSNRLCEKEYSVEFDKCPFCGTPNPLEESERMTLIENNKTSKDWGDNSNSNPFNVVVVSLIWISIFFFGIRGITSSIGNMFFEPAIGCLSLGVTLIGLVSLFFILQAKKWALFLWMGYRLSAGIINGIISSKYDFATNIIIAIANIGLMVLILQIKKNGVSAWSVIFNKQKFPNKNNETKIKKTNIRKSIFNRTQQSPKTDNKKTIEPNNKETEEDKPQISVSKVIADDIPPISNTDSKTIETPPTNISSDKQSIEERIYISENNTEKNCGITLNKKNSKTCLKNCKWWLYLLIVILILAIVWLVVFLVHHFNKSELGEYVYVDNSSILHSKRDCKNIAVYRGAKPVSILSLSELTSSDWQYICPECVTDKIYEQLQVVQLGTENRLWLYNTLNENGYNLGENYFIFDSIFRKRDDSRKWCYEKLHKEGFIIPSYEEFISDVGLDSEKPITRTINYEKSNLRKLYDSLKSNGAVKKSFENFHDYLRVEKNRMTLYKALKADNWDVPDSYENFKRTLFEQDTLS